ncbi:DUF1521 domain-containing protein [Comamonadaceae bacterium OH2545_COT-014]|nr:DUF1521 domain-containing protein [Comamonadaceae bacterium OH2545_COT-014]
MFHSTAFAHVGAAAGVHAGGGAAAAGAAHGLAGLLSGRAEVHVGVFHTHVFSVGCCKPCGTFTPAKPDAKWTVNNSGDGKATVDLGKYELQLDERSSQIKIVNKANGEVTHIHGDPHIDWNKDGKTDADFWTKTTFQLEDGTKITIDTVPWKGNSNMTLADTVTVTRGDNALQIKGLSQNELGDMTVEYADRGGQALDWAVTDGFVVHENTKGEGWINPATGKLATQEDFNITKPDAVKPYEFTQELGQAFGLFLATGFLGGLGLGGALDLGWRTGDSSTDVPRTKPLQIQPTRVEADNHTVTIHHRSGSTDTKSGGSLAWRTNNPGLLPYNAMTRALGAVGEVDGVAVFASEAKGQAALTRALLGLLTKH